jgi:hypothetical protein
MNGMLELSCRSHNGSVTHFYHFYFACLIPLIDFRMTHPYDSLSFTTSVGPFHSILTELPLDLSFVSDQSSHKILLPSYDIFDEKLFIDPSIRSTYSISSSVRHNVLTFLNQIPFKNSFPHLSSSSRLSLSSSTPLLIVLIGRDHQLDTRGFARRHIRNHEILQHTLSQKYPGNFRNVYLEQLSFLEQFHLFQSTALLIAQHGAALSNIFFMSSISPSSASSSSSCTPPSQLSHVIEISPPWSRRARYFRNLADTISVSYSSIYQQRNKGNVSVEEVMSHVDCVLSSWRQRPERRKGEGPCDHHALGRLCGDARCGGRVGEHQ